MTTAVSSPPATSTVPENVAELLKKLGDIPPERVRLHPPLGTATEEDVLKADAEPRKRLCELIDGVLVEKAMGTREALLAAVIVQWMGNFVEEGDLGVVLGGDGFLKLVPGRVRIPDVSFIAWERMSGGKFPEDAIASLAPDLAVEVFSPSNTEKEILAKVRDFFAAGTRLMWVIYPKTQTAKVYTDPDTVRRVTKAGKLDGGDVLPGFSLALPDLFARTVRRPKKKR